MQEKLANWSKRKEKQVQPSENVDEKDLSIEELNEFWEEQEKMKQKQRDGRKADA